EVGGEERRGIGWGGSLLEEARLQADVQLLPAAPFAFEASNSLLQADVLAPELGDAPRVLEHVAPDTGGKVSLADAKVVVSGGRGVGSSEGFAVPEGLAAVLGAAGGCSRVVPRARRRPPSDPVR